MRRRRKDALRSRRPRVASRKAANETRTATTASHNSIGLVRTVPADATRLTRTAWLVGRSIAAALKASGAAPGETTAAVRAGGAGASPATAWLATTEAMESHDDGHATTPTSAMVNIRNTCTIMSRS